MVLEIKSTDEFNAKLVEAGDKLVVVDFYATWCGPCKLIAPQIEAKAGELADSVLFLKVDVDENEELVEKYEISSMPTFVFFKNGGKIDAFSGANFPKLEELIKKHSS